MIGEWSEIPHPWQAGTRWPLDGTGVSRVQMLKTGRPARIDDYTELPGTIAAAGRKPGSGRSAGAPIIVDGDVWGAMAAANASRAALPDQHRGSARRLHASWSPRPSRTPRAGRVSPGWPRSRPRCGGSRRWWRVGRRRRRCSRRSRRGRTTALVSTWREWSATSPTTPSRSSPGAGDRFPVGSRWPLGAERTSPRSCWRPGRPARLDDYAEVRPARSLRASARQGIRSAVGTPIIVEGRLWGLMATALQPGAAPAARIPRSRLASFTELVATAIANAEARTEVAASRARIVAAADEERRRVVRDLHDGAQQRLVHTVITLKLAHAARCRTSEEDAPALVTEALDHAERATVELRELAHGILPSGPHRGWSARGSGRADVADAGAGGDRRVHGPASRRGRGDRVLRRRRGAHQRRQTRSGGARRGDRARRGRSARGPGTRRRRRRRPARRERPGGRSGTGLPPSTAISGSRARPTAARSSPQRSPSPAVTGRGSSRSEVRGNR